MSVVTNLMSGTSFRQYQITEVGSPEVVDGRGRSASRAFGRFVVFRALFSMVRVIRGLLWKT